MIRAFTGHDLPQVMSLWLDTNIAAHDFIPKEYWLENLEAVAAMLPHAELYVYEQAGKILGFVGLDAGYIAGIFVSGAAQSRGIGQKLLEYCMGKYARLTLNVYEKNRRAVEFYRRAGFRTIKPQTDENTGEPELFMEWNG